MYTNDLREKTLSEQYIKMQNNVYFTQNQPVKEILSGFLGYLKANGYSSRVVANTLTELSKIYSTRGILGYSGNDLSIRQLKHNTRFQKLIDAFEFGHIPGIEFSFKDTASMIQALTSLKFRSFSLQKRMMEKLKAIICKKDSYNKEFSTFRKDFPLKYEKGVKLTGRYVNDFMLNSRFQKYISDIIEAKEDTLRDMDAENSSGGLPGNTKKIDLGVEADGDMGNDVKDLENI